MRKRMMGLFLSAVLCMSMFIGCGDSKEPKASAPETAAEGEDVIPEVNDEQNDESQPEPELSSDPLEKMTQGYYSFTYPVEGRDDMVCYFHFYKERPVIGRVFYAGFAWNQVSFAGTYTVEEAEYAYACHKDRDASLVEGAEPTEGVAPFTITFYDFDGNILDVCGFDGEILYRDQLKITGAGDGNVMYYLDALGEDSPYYETYAAEPGIIYLDFVAEEPTSTLTLHHNGRYIDMVNMMVEGNWSVAAVDGGYEYTLTPDSDSDTAAVLKVSEDKATGIYLPTGGEEIPMTSTNAGGTEDSAVMLLSGETEVQEGVMADITGKLYADGTVTLMASAFGNEVDLDTGTYTMGDDGFTVTFQFENAGEIVSVLGESGASIQYVQAGTMAGDIDTELAISRVE